MPREAQQPADRHGRRPGHSERGDVAPLDGDLPRAVERPAGRDLVAREAAQSAARRYALVRQDAPSDSVYVVVSGRFEVWVEGQTSAITEIGVGEPIGEIGFFSGAPRTATIIAARDSVVLELDRASFDDVARAGAGDLSDAAARAGPPARRRQPRGANEPRGAAARTIAVIAGGTRADPAGLLRPPRQVVGRRGKGRLLDARLSRAPFPRPHARRPVGVQLAQRHRARIRADRLSGRRHAHRLDPQGDPASRPGPDRGLRRGAGGLNPVEAFAFATHPPARRRLVCLHERRTGWVEGTAAWLAQRDVRDASPRLAGGRPRLQEPASLPDRARGRLRRRRRRRIRPGPYRRLQGLRRARRRSSTFSAAPASARRCSAAFRCCSSPEEVDLAHPRRVRDQPRLQARAPSRATRCSTMCRSTRRCGGNSTASASRTPGGPIFAVATVLDGSAQGPYLIRRGPFWKAVRASGSLPAVLPPVFTDDGRMLVDGGVIDNIPLRSMKTLKAGPNLVVHFGVRDDAAALRGGLREHPGALGACSAQMLTPAGRRKLPAVPNPISVLQRCLVMHQSPELLPVGPLDLVLAVPALPGAQLHGFRPPLRGVRSGLSMVPRPASTSWTSRAARRWRRFWRPRIERDVQRYAAGRAARIRRSASAGSSRPS